MIDVYATERHYLDHLLPVVNMLAADARLLVGDASCREYALARGAQNVSIGHPAQPGRPTLVAARKDARRVYVDRRLGFLEHGVGQTYVDHPRHANYAGGDDWERCSLFMVPGPHAARAWEARYDAPVVQLGGAPRLDRLFDGGVNSGAWDHVLGAPIVAAVSFHWDARAVAPEAASTWRYWIGHLRALRQSDITVIGHGHPRAARDLRGIFERLDIPFTPSFDAVLDTADVYVCDNSSTLYEFAATDRPVLCLNAPTYRRDIEHGLRFWTHMPGIDIDVERSLEYAILEAFDDPPAAQVRRQRAMSEVYDALDGKATERACWAIRTFLDPDGSP